MKLPLHAPSARLARAHSGSLALISLGSAFVHGILAGAFFLGTALGGSRAYDGTEPLGPAYSDSEFFFLVGVQIVATILLLVSISVSFMSFRGTLFLNAGVVALDLIFLVVEWAVNDYTQPGLPGFKEILLLLLLLTVWIGPPLIAVTLAAREIRRPPPRTNLLMGRAVKARDVYSGMQIPPARVGKTHRVYAPDTQPLTSPRRLVIAMLLGMLYGLALMPFWAGWLHLILIGLAVAIPTYPHLAHWIVAPYLALATLRWMLVLVTGPADAFPGATFAFILTIVMLRLVLRGQRDLGLRDGKDYGYTEPGLGNG